MKTNEQLARETWQKIMENGFKSHHQNYQTILSALAAATEPLTGATVIDLAGKRHSCSLELALAIQEMREKHDAATEPLEKEIERMKASLEWTDALKVSAESYALDFRKERDQLRAELDEQKRFCETSRNTLHTLLEDARQERDALRARLERYPDGPNEAMKEELRQARAEVERLKQFEEQAAGYIPLPDYSKRCAELEVDNNQLRSEVERMKEALVSEAGTRQELNRRIIELRTRITELEADKARLDWLDGMIEQGRGSVELGITENGNIGLWRNNSDKTTACGDSLRAAIDAAKEGK